MTIPPEGYDGGDASDNSVETLETAAARAAGDAAWDALMAASDPETDEAGPEELTSAPQESPPTQPDAQEAAPTLNLQQRLDMSIKALLALHDEPNIVLARWLKTDLGLPDVRALWVVGPDLASITPEAQESLKIALHKQLPELPRELPDTAPAAGTRAAHLYDSLDHIPIQAIPSLRDLIPYNRQPITIADVLRVHSFDNLATIPGLQGSDPERRASVWECRLQLDAFREAFVTAQNQETTQRPGGRHRGAEPNEVQ